MSPRIIKFDSAANFAVLHALNSTLDGTSRLCWAISLTYPAQTSRQGWGGVFAVDAQTGKLDSEFVGPILPESIPAMVRSNLVQSSAHNITISQETFQMSVNATGLPHSVPVVVPGVLMARPGSTASIQVNFASNFENYFVANLTFSNPLPNLQNLSPNGLPPGVSASFSNNTIALQGAVSTTRTIFLTIKADAPTGTYLLYLNTVLPSLLVPVPFFFTIWNGTGQWPPPPSVG
jgi:hypothetical protein